MSHGDPQPPLRPLPVQPLAYSTPLRQGRPGLLTAVGVISIVVASLGLLSNAWGTLSVAGMFFMSQMGGAMTATAAGAIPVAPAEDRMRAEAYAVVVDGLVLNHPLTPGQRQELEELMARAGHKVAPFFSNDLTPAEVAEKILESGQLGGDQLGHYFLFDHGRLEVGEGFAAFYPDDGIAIRTAGGVIDNPLSDWQIEAFIQAVQDYTPQVTLTQAQLDALADALREPGQAYLTAAETAKEMEAQMLYASAMPDGSVWIGTTSSTLQIDAAGQAATGWGGRGAPLFPQISTTALGLAMLESVASLALSILLLVGGIMVLRQSPRGGKVHWWYALLKIPVAGLGIVAWGLFYTSMVGSMTQAMGGGPGGSEALFLWGMAAAWGGIGMIYPIALLIILRTRTVREYYATVQHN